MVKLILLHKSYGPYHFARSTTLNQFCTSIGWHLTAMELARSEEEYAWQTSIQDLPYDFVSILENQAFEAVPQSQIILKLWKTLSAHQPSVIVLAGYAEPSMLAAFAWCKLHRVPVILMSDSKEDDATRQPLKEKLKSWILKRCHAAFVAGQPHRRYFKQLGLSDSQIFLGCDVVGNEVFHPNKIQSLPKPIEFPFFLTISRFVPKKNLLNLIDAYANYIKQAKQPIWHLVICGDGVLRHQIEEKILAHGLSKLVHLPGFLQQDGLLPYFAHAQCFIHASSQDQWGLVVNEAMAAGLPILVSKRSGCFEDLVLEGVNGFGFDPADTQELAILMQRMTETESLSEMGAVSLQHIQNFSPECFAKTLIQATKSVLSYSCKT